MRVSHLDQGSLEKVVDRLWQHLAAAAAAAAVVVAAAVAAAVVAELCCINFVACICYVVPEPVLDIVDAAYGFLEDPL